MAAAGASFGLKHIAKGIGRLSNHVFVKGEGSYIYTTEGKKLLDFTAGIGVTNLGHCHPRVTKAAQDQLGKLVHGQVNIAFHEPQLQLIEKLKPIMPHESLDTFFFWNSGAEAVEAAVKLARMATGKPNIIVMQGSYHGRTMGTMAMTKVTPYKPMYTYIIMLRSAVVQNSIQHGILSLDVANANSEYGLSNCCNQPLNEFKIHLKQQTEASDTAAIIIEPVLGEGGYVFPPENYLAGVREICDQHGILMILDEVQTGFGRTGKYFASEHFGVRPDILIMAKGIANGLPLSAIVSRKELMDLQKPGSMGGTYAGNAVACAAGVAVQDVFREEKVLDNVAARSKQLLDRLHALRDSPKTAHMFRDIRGRGLMIGCEFSSPSPPTLKPRSDAPKSIASRVQNKCLENDMLTLTTSIYETIRFIPMLTVSESEMDEGLDIFSKAVEDVAREG